MKRVRKLLCLALALVMALSLAPTALGDGGHVHSWRERSRTEPTCTMEGSVIYVCSCGETKAETLPALGHAWNAGEILEDEGFPGGKKLHFWCWRCGATRDEPLPAEEPDDYGWEPPEEPEEPASPDGAVSPISGEAEGSASIELESAHVWFTNGLIFQPGCKVSLAWYVKNTGDVMVYDAECELYRWNKNAGDYVPFDPGDALTCNSKLGAIIPHSGMLQAITYTLEPYTFSEEDLKNAKDGFLEIMVTGRAHTEEGVELESEPLIFSIPIFDASIVVEAEDCSAGQVPEGGYVKVGLTAKSAGTETFTHIKYACTGYDKDGLPYSAVWEMFFEGYMDWVAPGKPEKSVVNILVTEADVEAGEVRRDLTLWFLRRYRTDGGTVFPDTPEEQIVTIQDMAWFDVFPPTGWVAFISSSQDFVYPATVEIVVPLLEPPEEPAPVPERLPFCEPALTGLGEGTAEWTLTRCGEHAALAGTAESKTPEEALALWQEALDAEYEAWLAEADESLRPAIEAERDAFREQLEAYRAAWAELGGEELGAEKAAELTMHKVSLLCFSRQADEEAWAALLGEAENLESGQQGTASCSLWSQDLDTELRVREQTCENHRGLGLQAADAESARALKLSWLQALNEETDEWYLSADEESRPLIAEARQSFGRWLAAEEALLNLQYPDDPALVQQLLALAVRSRAMDSCGLGG